MKRFLTALLLITFVVTLTACSNKTDAPASEPSILPQETSQSATPPETTKPQEVSQSAAPLETTEPEPTLAPEPEGYAPMDIFGKEFNPYADLELPNVFAASFNKGSAKLEGRNPFILSMTAEGNMYAAVAYQADLAGLSEEEKGDRFNEYSKNAFCEFTGKDGRVVTIRQTQPHDAKHENGACIIELTYDVPPTEMEKYTKLIRDNYSLNTLAAIGEYLDIGTDFSECSISVDLQKKETVVAVQYYTDDADAVQQQVADNLQCEWGEFYGIPSASISCGLIRNTLVFDSRFGAAVLILQTSNELSTPLGEYAEPEFSLVKIGFGFDDAGTCGVYEERDPHYKSVAIHRPEWGEHPDGWNIEYMDKVNGYDLRITYHADEDMYHISLEKDGGAAYDYFPATGEHGGHPDEVAQIFNDVFGTQDDDFYDKPLVYFEQFVQERFNMSIKELYALPKQ